MRRIDAIRMRNAVRAVQAALCGAWVATPMLFVPAVYDICKNRDLLSAADIPLFAVGLVVSWLSA